MKRKQVDNMMGGHIPKKRREGEEGGESFESDMGAQGAKHWTDEEKSKLFSWLMGPGQDDHWNALRATKNSCLREASLIHQSLQAIAHGRDSAQSKYSAARRHIKPSRAVTNEISIFSPKYTLSNYTTRRRGVALS